MSLNNLSSYVDSKVYVNPQDIIVKVIEDCGNLNNEERSKISSILNDKVWHSHTCCRTELYGEKYNAYYSSVRELKRLLKQLTKFDDNDMAYVTFTDRRTEGYEEDWEPGDLRGFLELQIPDKVLPKVHEGVLKNCIAAVNRIRSNERDARRRAERLKSEKEAVKAREEKISGLIDALQSGNISKEQFTIECGLLQK